MSPVEMAITDLSGRSCWTERLAFGPFERQTSIFIPQGGLAPGIYLVRFSNATGVLTSQLFRIG